MCRLSSGKKCGASRLGIWIRRSGVRRSLSPQHRAEDALVEAQDYGEDGGGGQEDAAEGAVLDFGLVFGSAFDGPREDVAGDGAKPAEVIIYSKF